MPDTNETNLEQTFSDLAYTTLRDRASALLDYLIGFQMLKQEEEGKRAVGIFGFEIEDKVYYVPVFFLNGEIRGMDALYSSDSDLFVPLIESWINSIINKRQLEVGEKDTRSRNERGVRVPSYIRLKTLPSSHGAVNLKLGADQMSTPREYDGTIGLPQALQEAGAVNMFKTAVLKNAKLREAFEQFYEVMDLAPAAPQQKTAAEQRPVTIITSITDEKVSDLSDSQREQLMADGVAVIDKRPEVSKSILYATEARRALENPTDGGLYDVLWGDGTVEPALVMQTTDGMPHVFVLRLSDGKHCTIAASRVTVLRQYSAAEYAKELDKAGKTPSEVRPGNVAVFASYDGTCTGGFCIRQRDQGISDTVVLIPEDQYFSNVRGAAYDSSPIAYSQGPRDHRRHRVDPNERVTAIVIGSFGSKEPIYTENKLVVNDKGFRAIVVNQASFTSQDHYVEEKYSDKKPDIILCAGDFGDFNTIVQQLQKTAQDLTVWRTDNQINVRDQKGTHSLSKTAALSHLMINHGMGESDARMVVDTVRADTETFYVKYAESFEGFPEFPGDDVDATFGNEMDAFHDGQIPISMRMPKTPKDNREFYSYQSPFGGGGHEGNGVAGGEAGGNPLDKTVEAAKSGQKEVFDASVMGSLLKSHAPLELVDRFMPTIITGMDRVGRILFLLMWHYKDFEDRYGENDLAELIDNLKSTFNDMGEVVMFLKKRTLSGDPDAYGLGVGANSIEGAV
jgi:hypothetical protein